MTGVKSLRMHFPHWDIFSVSLSLLSPTGGDVCKGSIKPLLESSCWLTAGWIHMSASRIRPHDWDRLYPVSLKSRETSQMGVPT